MQNTKHWTAESDVAFVHKLGFDFIAQIEKRMEEINQSQAELAKRLGITEGAVSKMLNNPQNLTLKTIAKYAKALGIKAAIIAYDDDDPMNEKGLIPSEIFSTCWRSAGKPRNIWDLYELESTRCGTQATFGIGFSRLSEALVRPFQVYSSAAVPHPVTLNTGFGLFKGWSGETWSGKTTTSEGIGGI